MTTGPRPGSSFLTYPAPGEWAESAGCRGMAPAFDSRLPGESPDELQARIRNSTAVCRSCPVLVSCRAWVMAAPRRHRQGIVAGRFWETVHPSTEKWKADRHQGHAA